TGSSALQAIPGVVFFHGPGLLEVSGHTAGPCRALGDDLDPGTGCPRRARPAGRGRSPHHPGARNRALGPDRNVDPGPRWHQDRPGRGSRRSPSPPRPATGVTAKMTNSMWQLRTLTSIAAMYK